MHTTKHHIHFLDARNLAVIASGSIHLVVTSPPYPMIAMWDALFGTFDPDTKTAIAAGKGLQAFELMHRQLDLVWNELDRVLHPGGFICINIGDATRKIGTAFQLYANHARIIRTFYAMDYESLPLVLWRKTTNAPNKFMGSGMLPAGAYVTLEHEYILIFRKKGRRTFLSAAEKQKRRSSAFFWEERNSWFSDIWNLAGSRQSITDEKLRARSAAFPFELAYRLINMYSVKGDTVLDPFLGTGTTLLAGICSCRNSIGVEIDATFKELLSGQVLQFVPYFNRIIDDRVEKHIAFINQYMEKGKAPKYTNIHYGFPVITTQEQELLLDKIHAVQPDAENGYIAQYCSTEESVLKSRDINTNLHKKRSDDLPSEQSLLDFE